MTLSATDAVPLAPAAPAASGATAERPNPAITAPALTPQPQPNDTVDGGQDPRPQASVTSVGATPFKPAPPAPTGGGALAAMPSPLEPAPRSKDNGVLKRVNGPLWLDGGPRPEEITQGALGDCYLVSTVADIAKVDKDVLRRMVVDNGDGTYTVTFKERVDTVGAHGGLTHSYRDVNIRVSNKLYVRGETLRYGRGSGAIGWPLIEKAWAVWKGGGSYDNIEGGSPRKVMEAIYGRDGEDIILKPEEADQTWAKMKEALDANLPVCADSVPDAEGLRATGILDAHVYSVLRTWEENGTKYVELREPNAMREPKGNGKVDGIFKLTMEELEKKFCMTFRMPPT